MDMSLARSFDQPVAQTHQAEKTVIARVDTYFVSSYLNLNSAVVQGWQRSIFKKHIYHLQKCM